MSHGSWRQGPLVGLAAVVLAVLIAQFAVAGGSDDAKIASLQRQVDQLRAEVTAPASAAKKKKPKRGPAGPPGPRGAQGLTGPAGSPAGGMLFGWVEPADLPSAGGSKDFSPLGSGDAGINVGNLNATPNSTVVLRDLFVRVNGPPGLGAKWVVTLQGASSSEELTCEIIGSFATACNSGSQTATIPGGGTIRLIVQNLMGAAATNLYYAYRVGSP